MSAIPFVAGPSDFLPPPYQFSDLASIVLLVKSNAIGLLQDVCDAALNTPLNRAPPDRFEVTNDKVLLVFSRFPESESTTSLSTGFLSYQEVALLVAVWDHKNARPGLYPRVLFLDGPQSGTAEYFATLPIAIGRELFGLPKVRGEIDLCVNPLNEFRGELRSLFPSSQYVALKLGGFVRIMTLAQSQLETATAEIEEAEIEIASDLEAAAPRDRRARLVEELRRLRRQLDDRSRSKVAARRHHPLEWVVKVWGPGIVRILDELPVSKRPELWGGDTPTEKAKTKERILKALELAQRPLSDADVAELDSLLLAPESSAFNALFVIGPSTEGMPLLGLRQLHVPDQFGSAEHQIVITSPFKLGSDALQPSSKYVAEFSPSQVQIELGLDEAYEIEPSEIYYWIGTTAVYGEPIEKVGP